MVIINFAKIVKCMKENITAEFNVLLKILNNMYFSQKFINLINLEIFFSIFFELLKQISITEFERTNCRHIENPRQLV